MAGTPGKDDGEAQGGGGPEDGDTLWTPWGKTSIERRLWNAVHVVAFAIYTVGLFTLGVRFGEPGAVLWTLACVIVGCCWLEPSKTWHPGPMDRVIEYVALR